MEKAESRSRKGRARFVGAKDAAGFPFVAVIYRPVLAAEGVSGAWANAGGECRGHRRDAPEGAHGILQYFYAFFTEPL